MKRIILIFSALLLLCGPSLQAAPVSRDRALEVAKMFFAAQPATKAAGDVQFIWDGEGIATKAAVQPAFYVFGRDGGGFVIVAGDDNVQPILALSDRNEFKVEGMPENVKWWMERMKAYIRNQNTQSPAIRDQWAQFTATKAGGRITGEVTDKVEHLTPEWNQSDTIKVAPYYLIYNSLCPKDLTYPERFCLTGCVATAISEVLTTMSGIYGIEGQGGTLPTHASNGPIAPYDAFISAPYVAATGGVPYPLGAEYDWAGLRTLTNKQAIVDAYNSGNTALLENLARLMADMGAIMHAQYKYNDTGAATSEAPDTLMKYMGISKTAYYDYAAKYSHPKWEAKLMAELDVRPIVYTGRSTLGGHAFVFDGYGTYEGDHVFHVNFGWGGNCNGYYYEYNLDAGAPGYDFSSECAACFNFYPDPASSPIQQISYFEGGLEYTTDPPTKKGDSFSIQFVITAKDIEHGKFKIVAEDRNGKEKQILYSQDFSQEPLTDQWFCFDNDPLVIDYDFAFGDRIVCYYTENLDGEPDVWKKVEASDNNEVYIEELPLMPAAFIKTAASYKQNDWFELEVMNTEHTYKSANWTITAPDGTVSYLAQYNRDFKLTQSGVYKIVAALTYTVNHQDVVETIVTYITVQ